MRAMVPARAVPPDWKAHTRAEIWKSASAAECAMTASRLVRWFLTRSPSLPMLLTYAHPIAPNVPESERADRQLNSTSSKVDTGLSIGPSEVLEGNRYERWTGWTVG